MAALRAGADLAYIFCAPHAAIPIKSYSPDVIVYPLLTEAMVDTFEQVAAKLDVVIVGPGLSADATLLSCAREIVRVCMQMSKHVILDGDGIRLLTGPTALEFDPRLLTTTPNHREFDHLCRHFGMDGGDEGVEGAVQLAAKLGNSIIVRKGAADIITDGRTTLICDERGTERRCGGQGDLLTGILARALHAEPGDPVNASFKACRVLRSVARSCESTMGRSTLASDILKYFAKAKICI